MLDEKEQKKKVAEQRKWLEGIGRKYPKMEIKETQRFLVLSNMAPQHINPFITQLDQMYLLLCEVFVVDSKTNLWPGKVMIIAHKYESDYHQTEREEFGYDGSQNTLGICHPDPIDENIVITVFEEGRERGEFATTLVHETSHAFTVAYKSKEDPPSWFHEGIADWVAASVVKPAGTQIVKGKQRRSLSLLRSTGRIGRDFFTERGGIQGYQYGTASALIGFLIQYDAERFIHFFDAIKAGNNWEEAFHKAYDASPDKMLAAFGKHVGIRNLRL